MTDQIEVLSRDEVKIRSCFWRRSDIVKAESRESSIVYKLGWREILRMMDEFEEPAPKWEPGTVLINRQGWKYRLDKLIEANDPEMWEYTNMQSGRTSPGLFYPFAYKIHRLPHEFKVGDWAQWIDHTPGPFQVMNVQAVDGRETLYGFGAFLPAEECCHVPPPKEEKPSLLVKSCEHCGKTLDGMDPRIHPHGLGVCAPRNEKPENPFTGHAETPEEKEFNDRWRLVPSNRKSIFGCFQRDGESLVTANVGAWYESACYWKREAEHLRDELDRQAGRKP